MTPFIETEIAKQMINDFVRASKEHEEANLTEDEKAVAEQKTKLYKFWCGVTYGHLYKNCICLRCGKASYGNNTNNVQ